MLTASVVFDTFGLIGCHAIRKTPLVATLIRFVVVLVGVPGAVIQS